MTRAAASGAQQYKDGVTGQPGTQQIPAAGPGVEQSRTGQAMMGRARTSDAPPWWLPNLYWARPQRDYWPGAGMPVSVSSDNLMPVPARDPRGIPARLAAPIVQRGSTQIAARPITPTWPAWNG
jgi:hypothetical protein